MTGLCVCVCVCIGGKGDKGRGWGVLRPLKQLTTLVLLYSPDSLDDLFDYPDKPLTPTQKFAQGAGKFKFKLKQQLLIGDY